MTRKRISGDKRREEILNVAADLFIEHGFEGVSMGSLASEIGTSRPNIYTHFPRLEAILDALLAEHLARAEADLIACLQPGQRPDFGVIFDVLSRHRRLLLLLNCGGSASLRRKREEFDDAMIANLVTHLGSTRLTERPQLLPLVSGLLRGVIYEAVLREKPTISVEELLKDLGPFIDGGVRSVLERKPQA